MIIDVHVHERTHSADSVLTLEEIIQQGEKLGLDGVCITDHESQDIRFQLFRYRKETTLRLFYGMEILTPHGDLLVFGVDDMPSVKQGTNAFIQAVNQQQGALVSAHPFRRNNRGFGDAIRQFPQLHAVEGYNGNTAERYNQQAVALGRQLSMPLVGGSDAHRRERLGIYATHFNMDIHSEKQLAQAIRRGLGSPVKLTANGYQSLVTEVEQQEAV